MEKNILSLTERKIHYYRGIDYQFNEELPISRFEANRSKVSENILAISITTYE